MKCYDNRCCWFDRKNKEDGYCGYGLIYYKDKCENPITSVKELKKIKSGEGGKN